MTHQSSQHPHPQEGPDGASTPGRAVPVVLALLVFGLVAAVVGFGVLPAMKRRDELARSVETRGEGLQRVVFIEAVAAPANVRMTLPARIRPAQETALFAQAGGYLGPMTVDVGDRVEAGQVLVTIATPVLERQIAANAALRKVAAARIELAQTRLDLSRASLARLEGVGDVRAVSRQSIDEAAAAVKSDAASLAAAVAEVGSVEAAGLSLEAQRALARIAAPFAGEVTERGFDAGALIVADKVDPARPIYRIVDRESVRVMIDVPQSLAMGVAVGQTIEVSVREIPGKTLSAKIVRAAPELDRATRTRLVEASLPNADHALLPGMFAEATVLLPRGAGTTLVPGEAIVVRDGKQMLAVIDAQDAIHYLPAVLGADNGAQVEVLSGLASGARVAVGLSRQPAEGAKVEPVVRPKA